MKVIETEIEGQKSFETNVSGLLCGGNIVVEVFTVGAAPMGSRAVLGQ